MSSKLTDLISRNNSLLVDVIEQINRNGKGIVFIVGNESELIGVVTDGDVRRALLSGHRLSDPIAGFVNTRCKYFQEGENYIARYQEINKDLSVHYRTVPIVDTAHRLVDYFQLEGTVHIPVASPAINSDREISYLVDAFLSGWISSSGKYIDRFENDFARFCETKHAVAVANGTVAIHLALIALGIGPGDEVIVPDLTFAATINTVLHAGATPVIVDIKPDCWTIDPEEIEKAISPKTKAIIPVHLYGQPCEMEAIMNIAKRHDLYVIEDCAEAHGATFDGKPVGSIGDVGCFSFYGNKIITTGEGGMCTTQSQELTEKMRTLRDHGMSRSRKYFHEVVGYNYRMTNLQAALGCAQLERISDLLAHRESIEGTYRDEFRANSSIQFQRTDLPRRKKVTWLVSALVEGGEAARDACLAKLKEAGVDCRRFFYPLSEMPIYAKYAASSSPVSRSISRSGINFPTHNLISRKDIAWLRSMIS